MRNPKYKIIFEILKESLYADVNNARHDIKLPADVTWEEVYEEMRVQAVSALAADWAAENPMLSDGLKQIWQKSSVLAVRRWLHIMNEQEELTRLLNREQIEFAIIKGAAAAIEYPQPEYRVMGDVDLLVKKERIHEVYRLLLKNGYEDTQLYGLKEKDLQRYYHIGLMKNGVEFEVHWGLVAERQKKEYEGHLEELLYANLGHTEVRMMENYHVTMFPCVYNGLILLNHILRHLRETALGLRQIIDWMMFANAHMDDESWETKFQTVFRELNLETFSIHVTRMCQLYLGLREEGMTWCRAASPDLCEEILAVVMASGNYGLKTQKTDKGIRTMMRYRSFGSLIKDLHTNGMRNWPSARKIPLLRPFAGFYQIGRYINLAVQKKSPVKSLLNLYAKSKRHETMLERLGVGRDIR